MHPRTYTKAGPIDLLISHITYHPGEEDIVAQGIQDLLTLTTHPIPHSAKLRLHLTLEKLQTKTQRRPHV